MTGRLRHLLALALGLFCGQLAFAQGWQLVWQDEFHGSISPDWVFETGNGTNGWGNNELQYYRRENATVENDALVITARREDFGGFRYTSARMKTQGRKSFKYGRIEARIALPAKLGTWPAFWMLGSNIGSVGWPASGEIDVMEQVNTSSEVHGTVHWRADNGSHASYGGRTGTSVTNYHVYAVEWDAKFIRWFVDGQQYHVIDITNNAGGTEEFHKDFFLLLNMAVGGNWPGFNVDESALPARMHVDYVRVYQLQAPGTAITLEAERFAVMQGVQAEACSEGGQNLGWIDAGDWVVWDVNVPESGTYTVQYRVASLGGGGVIQLERAGGSPVYGSVYVPATGGWQNWTTVSHQVQLAAGQQQIAVKALVGGWNLNWLKISR
ncbi:carbohydrate-binding protein [Methylibium rhizosphaerae]|uniref:carbohydrate-binding protein n=1 Tax=Methylibium rhizosphaerae TaxID=2570323 RepID=UPI00112D323A|nr:carbohydrate-binding protein [Methylibium rhizosphaerae]